MTKSDVQKNKDSKKETIDESPAELYRKLLAKVWEDGILTIEEKQFLDLIREKLNIKDETHTKMEDMVLAEGINTYEAIGALEQTKNPLEKEYRRRYPLKYRCNDGHIVRSQIEVDVDNYLYEKGIIHSYQSGYIDPDGNWVSDFYLPKLNLYIEVWDQAEKTLFEERQQKKLKAYSKNPDATPINLYEPNAVDALDRVLKPVLETEKEV